MSKLEDTDLHYSDMHHKNTNRSSRESTCMCCSRRAFDNVNVKMQCTCIQAQDNGVATLLTMTKPNSLTMTPHSMMEYNVSTKIIFLRTVSQKKRENVGILKKNRGKGVYRVV